MGEFKKRYSLRYLPLFWSDLNAAVTYAAEDLGNPDAAERLLDQVEARILDHLTMPCAAAVYKGTKECSVPYHWFEVGSYMVFYVVIDDVVEVRRFLYGARDLTRMLP
ncbi:type II toxin-antitoxin system RelE/ParE family toxin [Rubneribacter sp.]